MLARCMSRWIGKGHRRALSTDKPSEVLDSYHINPMGDSDVSQRSRISFLSEDMLDAKKMGVRGLSCYGFRLIDGSFLWGPVALFPKSAMSWRVRNVDEITPESLCLFGLLEPKIDILVLGVGDKKNIDKVRARVIGFLREHKIGLEISDTEDALATFNFLNAENRYVAAALFPPDDLIVTDEEYGRAMNLLKNFDEIEVHPLLGGEVPIDERDDLVKKLWDENSSWEEVKRTLLGGKNEEDDEAKKISDK